MKENIIGELRIMSELNIKPNISELSRRYGLDRHTIKKYCDAGKLPERKKRTFISKWDIYEDEIRRIIENEAASKMATYQYLLHKYSKLPGGYNGFKAYTLRKGITLKKAMKPHVLYESDPGELLQFDWQEDIRFIFKSGDTITFNVFSATLAYSRLHIFIFSYHRSQEDLIRCLIEVYRRLGGVTKTAMTDNMSAIVSLKDGHKKIHQNIRSLMNDLCVKLKLCKVKSPQTKGKVESSNRFLNWLRPYNRQLDSVEELIEVIEKVISSACNKEKNKTTNIPPLVLFKKEKEYLRPLGNLKLMNSYLKEHHRVLVPETLLVNFKGHRYSIPKRFIGKYVDIYPCLDDIYIYYQKDLIAIHTISQQMINYSSDHYLEALKTSFKDKCDIEDMAKDNLSKLSKLGGDNEIGI